MITKKSLQELASQAGLALEVNGNGSLNLYRALDGDTVVVDWCMTKAMDRELSRRAKKPQTACPPSIALEMPYGMVTTLGKIQIALEEIAGALSAIRDDLVPAKKG